MSKPLAGLAQLEADRAGLERLREDWLEHRSENGRVGIDRRTVKITRRAEQLVARDATLEEERQRLREAHERATNERVRSPAANGALMSATG